VGLRRQSKGKEQMEPDKAACGKCGIEPEWYDEYCIDCWPGYDLCKACGDYLCEHIHPDPEDLADPEFFSCHCRNVECKHGFIEGSDQRIMTQAEFRELQKSWETPEPPQS